MTNGLLATLALLILGPMAQGTVLAGRPPANEPQKAVASVKNPALDPGSRPMFALGNETLSIGGALAEGPAAFGRVAAVGVDAAGGLYVLDALECRIVVFDALGRVTRTIGRKGQGPGELNGPASLSLDEGRGEIMVQDAGNRLVYYGLSGEYRRTVVFRDRLAQSRVRIGKDGDLIAFGGILGVPGSHFTANKEFRLIKCSPQGLDPVVLATYPGHGDLSRYDPNLTVYWDIDPRGRIYAGYPSAYEIRIFDPDGRLSQRILAESKREAFTRQEKVEAAARIPPSTKASLGIEIADTHGAFGGLLIDDRGRLYVRTWTRDERGLFRNHVFDAGGRLIGWVGLPHLAASLRSGQLTTIESDNEGYPVVRRYPVIARSGE